MKHPEPHALALFAGGELPFWVRWQIRRHLRSCERCHEEVQGFRRRQEWFRGAAGELPANLHWNRLAAEMRANIQVGLAAGECVSGAQHVSERLGWRAAVALASITVVIVGGWWLHLPHPRVKPVDAAVLEATADGIELKQPEGALTLMHPGSAPVMVSVSAQGAMTARFVDEETGMVTVNNVYVE